MIDKEGNMLKARARIFGAFILGAALAMSAPSLRA
jgi:hypothetical protein